MVRPPFDKYTRPSLRADIGPPLISGSRRLLARLRDTMAGEGDPQERLDRIVSIIAADLVAEVCSIYVLRAGDILELFAATGLSPKAIHLTRLSMSEGLIGAIASQARPMALEDSQNHPAFVYRPETGEEIFHSLVGVPILRGGRVTGVLAVQNQTRRKYTEEEVETLETIAMVIAELIAGGNLFDNVKQIPISGFAPLSVTLEGVRLNRGIAVGNAIQHENQAQTLNIVAEDPEEENIRLERALEEMYMAIDDLLKTKEMVPGGEHREVLETYRLFAEDVGWLSRIKEAINTGLTAEAAVEKVRNDTQARFGKQKDPYFRERLHDFNDLANRLLQHLIGKSGVNSKQDLPDKFILFARDMGPAELLDYNPSQLCGLVLEGGSTTTHVAIVARALDIPVVGRAINALDNVETMDLVIVDGNQAKIHIRPTPEIYKIYMDKLKAWERRNAAYISTRNIPAETKDGIKIKLDINAGLLSDIENLKETGADGIGLYRTEISFMDSNKYPDVNSQADLYKKIIDGAKGKQVIFRTMDIGGDKRVPYWSSMGEKNPAMGWRAVRVSLDRPVLIRHQMRALIKAANGRNLNLMFPMITDVSEFDKAKYWLMTEIENARKKGRRLPKTLSVGCMLEVPALALQMPMLIERADFISVGSNDLFQFLFASDRNSPELNRRYDPMASTVLSFLRDLVKKCFNGNIPISLCGEIAGEPLEAMALIGIGFRHLSMAPPAIGPIKTMVRSLSIGNLEKYLDSLTNSSEDNMRKKLNEFASDNGVII